MLSNEQELLLECIKYNADNDKIKVLLTKKLNFSYILKLARHHSIETLLYYRLKDFSLDINKELSKYYYGTAAKNLLIYNELKKIIKIFNENKIGFLVVKGAYLAINVYKNISLRQMSDIDILIKEKDKKKIRGILKDYKLISDKNYEIAAQEFQYIKKINDFNLLIEISWDVKHLSTKDYSLFENANLIKYQGFSFKNLKDEDSLIYLIAHLREHHDYSSLHWLADLDWLINVSKIDYDFLIKEARKYNKLNELYFGLYLLKKIFNSIVKVKFNKLYFYILSLRYNKGHLFNLKKFKFNWERKKIIDSFFKDNFLEGIKQLCTSIGQYIFAKK